MYLRPANVLQGEEVKLEDSARMSKIRGEKMKKKNIFCCYPTPETHQRGVTRPGADALGVRKRSDKHPKTMFGLTGGAGKTGALKVIKEGKSRRSKPHFGFRSSRP